ncbi:MAG: winged helix-turn-helix domain-containing protein [Promethearchaeota archaeon]
MTISNDKKQNFKKKDVDVESSFYYALSHEIRRRIIKITGDNEFTSFTQLKNELKVSTGTIYHHLETLSDLIEQKQDKKYYLKELGIYAYNSLKDNIETIKAPQREFKSAFLNKLMVVTSKRFIIFNKKDRVYTVLISIGIIILGTIFCILNDLTSFLLFFIEINTENLDFFIQIIINMSFVLNFIAFFIIIELISRLFYKKTENTMRFLASFALIQFPMIFYLMFHFIFKNTALTSLNVVNFIDQILMVIFQAWSLWLLSYSLSVKKGLKIENSLIISLLLHYSGFTLILLTFI